MLWEERSCEATPYPDYATHSFTVQGTERPPQSLNNLRLHALAGTTAQLSWDLSTDADVLTGGSIHVRHTHIVGESVTWDSAVQVTDRLPGNSTLASVPLLSGTYLVKPVNASGFYAEKAAVVVSNMAGHVGYNRVLERDEPAGWPGEKFNAQIDSGNSLTLGRLDDLSNINWDTVPVTRGEISDSGNKEDGFTVWAYENTSDTSESYIDPLTTLRPIDVGDTFRISFYARTVNGSGASQAEVYMFDKYGGWGWLVPKLFNLTDSFEKYTFEYKIGTKPNQTTPGTRVRLDNNRAGSTFEFYNFRVDNISDSARTPHYIMSEPLDLNAVVTTRLTLETDASIYFADTIDDRTDPIDSWPLFDGMIPDSVSLRYEVSQTDDDPQSASASWSAWTPFIKGEFRGRAFRLKVSMQGNAPGSAATLASLKLIADVQDRTEKANNLNAPAGGLRVNYQTPFLAPASIAVTAHALPEKGRWVLSNQDRHGFNIRFYNGSTAIAANFDYSAISHGEAQ